MTLCFFRLRRLVADRLTVTHVVRTLAALALSMTSVARAQSTSVTPTAAPPTCRQTLDSLDAKTRQNYAGFLLEVRDARRRAYTSMLQTLARDADVRTLEVCFPVLARYVGWFDDPHLFVFQSGAADSVTAMRRRAALRRVAITEASVRAELTRRARALDPIEGIWYDGNTRYAVIPDPDGARGVFSAVLLTADTSGWHAGDIRAQFVRRATGGYVATMTTRGFGEQQLMARIHRRVLLRLSPGMWGKAFPVSRADSGTIDSVDVHRPRVLVRPHSVVVSVPSHDPRYAALLDTLVRAVADSIRVRKLLIVDLRGNEGGSSFMTRSLDPYINSSTRRATPYDSGVPVVLSSPAQISAAIRMAGSDTTQFIREPLGRMRANPGGLVPLESTPSAPAVESSLPGDWRVVVMVDGGTVSAAEVLVLRALRSSRAVVVGESTAGALDYQSVQIISLGTGDRRWALGYPTITAHADLPARGMRGKGIAPAVRVDWAKLVDPFAEMERKFGGRPSW